MALSRCWPTPHQRLVQAHPELLNNAVDELIRCTRPCHPLHAAVLRRGAEDKDGELRT